MRTYYLNNSGHRWINFNEDRTREKLLVWDGEKVIARMVTYWRAIGNFAVPFVRIKGKAVCLHHLGKVKHSLPCKTVPTEEVHLWTTLPKTEGNMFGHLEIE
jgi:hypothetical protein